MAHPPGVTFRSPGEGAVGPLVEAKDWSQTPLGPRERWPRTLEGYLRMVLALPAPAILFWGPELVQLYNDGYATIMGPRHPRYLGGTYRECWPDTYPTIYPWMRRVLAGEIVEVERTLIPLTRYGFAEEAYFTFSFSPLKDDEGRTAGILQLVTEMTGTVLAERRSATLQALAPASGSALLSNSARSLQALGGNRHDVPLALYWRPRAGVAAPGGSALALEWALGVEVRALPDAARAELEALAEAVFNGEAPREVEGLTRLLPAVAGAPWPEPPERALVLPVRRGPNEAPRGVLLLAGNPRLRFDAPYRAFFEAVASELAAQLVSEQERFLSEQLALALESAKLGGWRIDLRTRRIAVFERTAAFLGLRGAVEQDLDEINAERVHPEDLARVNAALEHAVEHNAMYSCEYRVRRTDGELRWLQSWGRAAYDASGVAESVTGITLDVTEQVEARLRIERLVDELAASVRARDAFISIASHELKTPLSSLKLQTQGIERALARGDASVFQPERVRRLVEQTERQTNRLSRLVEDMLDVGRINLGRLSLRKVRGDLAQLVRETADRLRPGFESQATPLVVRAEEALHCELDPDRLEQVLENLLTNALRYGARTPVRVEAHAADGAARVSVEDGGPGIGVEDQARIFERFERAISPNEVSGLGLGLFISREIVTAHGGRIWVESTPGRGARFCFELPRVTA